MNATRWYRRRLGRRTRAVLLLLLVPALVLSWVTDGTASLLVQAALVIAAAGVLVVGIRRAPA